LKQDPLIKVIFLCSPGNPTGTLLKQSDIKDILNCPFYNGVVVVDEAYIDFCEKDASVSSWVTEYPNLIVSQTLSKAFGLAAIRLGFTISSKEIAQVFNNTKAPYNISTPTATFAQRALSKEGLKITNSFISSIKQQRQFLLEELIKLPFIKGFLGSNDANFVLAQFTNTEGEPSNDVAFKIYKQLAEVDGVVVRYRGTEMGCTGCLRITVGTSKENQFLIEKLGKIKA
jgi:histidinol-phosphate aminotransferase